MGKQQVIILQQVACEGPGLLSELLASEGVPIRTVHLYRGERIPDVTRYRSLVVLGGPMSVYDEKPFPFLRAEDAAIKAAIAAEVPYMGICLGGQLLAKALGAPVIKNSVKEIGFYEVSLTREGLDDRLFCGLGPRLAVFQWHGDTFSLPENGTLLATAPTCVNQAFRYGRNAYAVQFHLETTSSMMKEWAGTYQEELDREGIQPDVLMPSDIETKSSLLRSEAEVMLRNFLALSV